MIDWTSLSSVVAILTLKGLKVRSHLSGDSLDFRSIAVVSTRWTVFSALKPLELLRSLQILFNQLKIRYFRTAKSAGFFAHKLLYKTLVEFRQAIIRKACLFRVCQREYLPSGGVELK